MPVSDEYFRIVVDLIAIVIFSIGVICPVKNTIIPYWKKFGRPSWAIFSRLFIRVFLVILIIYNLTFPVARLIGVDHTPLRDVSVVLYLVLSLLFLHSWFQHPDGISGL